MKVLLLLLCFFGFKPANTIDSLVAVCRSGNTLNVDYVDSMHGITKVKTFVKEDTLELNISVSMHVINKTFHVLLPKNIHFIKFGSITKAISKLTVCSNAKVLSGKEAIDSMRKMK